MSQPSRLILASQSPARLKLLRQAGFNPEAIPSHFDEDSITAEHPAALVQQLALAKARAVAASLEDPTPALLIGCDSVLLVNGEVWGKPRDAAEAIARWQRMRGQVGELYTGHALVHHPSGQAWERLGLTRVQFAMLSDAEIETYVATGEPLQCAGCFALEGRGGLYVERIDGCHSNVIGLSLPLLRALLAEATAEDMHR